MADNEIAGEMVELESVLEETNIKGVLIREVDNILYTIVYAVFAGVVIYLDKTAGIAMATALGGALLLKIRAK